MELNYIKEHTSCVNYKTEEDAGFALKEAALGEHFDNRQQEIKANHLIFILSGEVSITKDSKYNPQIQISAESETKRSIFREKDKTKRSKKESAQHSKSRNKSFVMTSVSAL